MYAVVLSEPFTVKAIPKVVNEEVESMDYVERGTLHILTTCTSIICDYAQFML